MERGQTLIFAVVLAALALFGLKLWSDRANEAQLTSGGQLVGDLARLGSEPGSDDAEFGGPGGGARAGGRGPDGRLSGDRRGPLRYGVPGRRGDGSSGSAGGGYLGSGRGTGDRGWDGGSAGGRGAGIAGGGGGSGAGIAGGDGASALAPKAQKRDDLVDFLSSQPATEPEFAKPAEDAEIALKLETTEDIDKQGGFEENVKESDEGEGIEITDSGRIEFPNTVNPEAATFEFSIKPSWSGSDQTDNALVQLRGEHEWANRLELVKNGEFLRFILTDNTGKESDISVRISDWQAGDQHDIRASYGPCEGGGGNCTYLYIDNRLAGTNRYEGQFQPPRNTPLFVGGDHQTSNYSGAGATFYGFTIKNNVTTIQ